MEHRLSASVWACCLPFVNRALARSEGGYTHDDVLTEVMENRAQLWPGAKSAAITQIREEEGVRWLHIWLAAGDMQELMVMLKAGEEFAREHKLEWVEINGRKGWTRVLRPHGYTEDNGVLRKVIEWV